MSAGKDTAGTFRREGPVIVGRATGVLGGIARGGEIRLAKLHATAPRLRFDAVVVHGRYERARDAAAAVTVPTMLVRGKQSNVVSEEGARELLELIPTAKLIDVSGAGHMVAGDDNDVFSGGLRGFLDDEVIALRP